MANIQQLHMLKINQRSVIFFIIVENFSELFNFGKIYVQQPRINVEFLSSKRFGGDTSISIGRKLYSLKYIKIN